MVCRKVLLVFFSILNVVFNEPSCFSGLIYFSEHFYYFASIDLSTFGKPFCFSGLVWCSRGLYWSFSLFFPFYFVFSEFICFSAPICLNEIFYLFALINLFALVVNGFLGFCVCLLFYFNVVLSDPLYFSDLFRFKLSFYLSA
jgi:hypothetical protein